MPDEKETTPPLSDHGGLPAASGMIDCPQGPCLSSRVIIRVRDLNDQPLPNLKVRVLPDVAGTDEAKYLTNALGEVEIPCGSGGFCEHPCDSGDWKVSFPDLKSLADYAATAGQYPVGSPESVKTKIGGRVNAGWIVNTCAIRLSRAVNYSEHDIPKDGNETISGGDAKQYYYRVSSIREYLEEQFGGYPIRGNIAADFAGRKGIIIFEVAGWDNATGHVDLWNGTGCENHCYFQSDLGPADGEVTMTSATLLQAVKIERVDVQYEVCQATLTYRMMPQ